MARTLGQCSRGRNRCDLGLQSRQCCQIFIQMRNEGFTTYTVIIQRGHSAWRSWNFKTSTCGTSPSDYAFKSAKRKRLDPWPMKHDGVVSDKEDHRLKTSDFIFSSQLGNFGSLVLTFLFPSFTSFHRSRSGFVLHTTSGCFISILPRFVFFKW